MNYSEAKQKFENRFKKTSNKVKLTYNTWLVKTVKGYGVRLYETVILEFLPNGLIRFNTGGWNTKTTHARMNEFLPEGISVHGGLSSYYKGLLRSDSLIGIECYTAKMPELLGLNSWEFTETRYNILEDNCTIDPKDGYVDYTDCEEPEELENVA